MSTKSLDYYISDISDPYGDKDSDQSEMQLEGYEIYKQRMLVDAIGTSECDSNIKLFLPEVLDSLSEQGKNEFVYDCYTRLIEAYSLDSLDDDKDKIKTVDGYRDRIVSLLIFIESGECTEFFASILPYIELPTLRNKDSLSDFLELNYKTFLLRFEENKEIVPNLLYHNFLYTSKRSGINTIITILSKNVLAVNAKQITKGVDK